MKKNFLLCLFTLVLSLVAIAAPPPLFYAIISDTQKPENDPLENVVRYVEEVNQVKPDFVLVPGDLTDRGRVGEYQNIMRVLGKLEVPMFAVPGNHEGPAGEKNYRKLFEQYVGQAPFSLREMGGWYLFMLDSIRFHGGKLAHEGGIPPAEMKWIEEQLKTVPSNAPIMISQHHPLRYAPIQTDNEEALLKLFDKHNLLLTVTGHKHRNKIFRDECGLLHVVTSSTSFPEKNIGYRWQSSVGSDLWTGWVVDKNAQPLRELRVFDPKGETPFELPPLTQKGLALRVRHASAATVTLVAKSVPNPPAVFAKTTGIVRTSADGMSLRLCLPAVAKSATSFVPLPVKAVEKLFSEGCRLQISGQIEELALYETSLDWQHYQLRRPEPPKGKVSILHPRQGETYERGVIPLVALLKQTVETPRVTIAGKTVSPDAKGWGALVFNANGLQSKSHKFKNHVYLNDALLSPIAPTRDVLEWEWFAFPVSPEQAEAPRFRLTAGTPTDGSGANPEANNEDYSARSLLYIRQSVAGGCEFRGTPKASSGKVISIGDNRPTIDTKYVFVPGETVKPKKLQPLLHVWDASNAPAGPVTLSVQCGEATSTVRILLK